MIVFAHLLNDRSGSPTVLCQAIQTIQSQHIATRLYLGSDGDGVLSTLSIPTSKYWYWRTGNKLGTFFTYFVSQFFLFFKMLFDREISSDAIVYVNTLLPFGAALYGRLTGKKVIYHIHELTVKPNLLRFFLVLVNRLTSGLNIYVSEAHKNQLPILGVANQLIYNSASLAYKAKASINQYKHKTNNFFNVLMIAYLREYKGVNEFVTLAKNLSTEKDISFELVLNDRDGDIKSFKQKLEISSNFRVYSRQDSIYPFYERANLVVNLSRADLVIETFGMTVLEAMSFGIPVIVPPIGGPAELVDDGVNGYLIDSRDADLLAEKVRMMYQDEVLCMRLSRSAKEKASQFSNEKFSEALLAAITKVQNKS